MRKLLVLLFVIFVTLMVAGCDFLPSSVTVTSIEVTGQQSSFDGNFQLSDLTVKVNRSDGSYLSEPLSEAMLSAADLEKFTQEGTHTISVTYLNQTTSFEITIQGEKGDPGNDGREVVFQVAGGYIQWQYDGDTTWTNLIEVADLTGPAGPSGSDGAAGPTGENGKQVVFQLSATHLQWKYEGDATWIDLIALTELMGEDGANGIDGLDGEDGKQIILQVGTTHIQWQYEGDATWNDLIALSELIGPQGEDGQDYIPEMVTVTFDLDGGTMPEGVLSTVEIQKGNSMVLPIPTKANHQFAGWFTGFTVNDNQFFNYIPISQNMTLYAIWQEEFVEEFTVTFFDGSFEYDRVDNIPSGSNVFLPMAPTKPGFIFKGWTASSGGTAIVSFPVVVTTNRNFYAVWEEEPATLENHFFLRKVSQTASQLVVEVVLGGEANVSGYDLRLNYEAEDLTYASYVNNKPNIINTDVAGTILFNFSDVMNNITQETILLTVTFNIVQAVSTTIDVVVVEATMVDSNYDIFVVETNATGMTVQ